jgi:hypothetical protein
MNTEQTWRSFYSVFAAAAAAAVVVDDDDGDDGDYGES